MWEPNVKRVSFPLPFPFLFFSGPSFAGASFLVFSDFPFATPPLALLPQAFTTGTEGPPAMFWRLRFPLTNAFGTADGAEDGSAGKADFEISGGSGLSFFVLSSACGTWAEDGDGFIG